MYYRVRIKNKNKIIDRQDLNLLGTKVNLRKLYDSDTARPLDHTHDTVVVMSYYIYTCVYAA